MLVTAKVLLSNPLSSFGLDSFHHRNNSSLHPHSLPVWSATQFSLKLKWELPLQLLLKSEGVAHQQGSLQLQEPGCSKPANSFYEMSNIYPRSHFNSLLIAVAADTFSALILKSPALTKPDQLPSGFLLKLYLTVVKNWNQEALSHRLYWAVAPMQQLSARHCLYLHLYFAPFAVVLSQWQLDISNNSLNRANSTVY